VIDGAATGEACARLNVALLAFEQHAADGNAGIKIA
jgi:hypothetical protein